MYSVSVDLSSSRFTSLFNRPLVRGTVREGMGSAFAGGAWAAAEECAGECGAGSAGSAGTKGARGSMVSAEDCVLFAVG